MKIAQSQAKQAVFGRVFVASRSDLAHACWSESGDWMPMDSSFVMFITSNNTAWAADPAPQSGQFRLTVSRRHETCQIDIAPLVVSSDT
jgi:hypothetical protein